MAPRVYEPFWRNVHQSLPDGEPCFEFQVSGFELERRRTPDLRLVTRKMDSSLKCNRIFSRQGCGTSLINTWLQPGEREYATSSETVHRTKVYRTVNLASSFKFRVSS